MQNVPQADRYKYRVINGPLNGFHWAGVISIREMTIFMHMESVLIFCSFRIFKTQYRVR